MTHNLPPTFVAEVTDIVGRAHVITEADLRAPYEVDWTGRFGGRTPAVLRPASTVEVAAIVASCRRHGIALVPQGGNTGLVGGSVPTAGEVVVSMRRLADVGDVDVAARQVTVAAGAILSDVRLAATRSDLGYAIDLGARESATIGGTIATNAGGVNLIRHGGTREQVVGIEAVLGNGDTISRLDGLVKDNTGYHFPSLLCGSEGTLAIVTRARLRLVSRHGHHVAAVIGFASVTDAVAAVAQWRSDLDSLEAAEVFLDEGLQLVCRAFELPLPFSERWPVYVLIEVAAHDDPTDELAAAVDGVVGVCDAVVATDEARRRALWRYREDHTLAIGTLGVPQKLDVTVPLSRLAEFIDDVPRHVAAVAPRAETWLFGHVGDGNIHVNITGVDPADHATEEAVLTLVSDFGGSISAEHGIGTAKTKWLHLNRSGAEIDAMRAIKRALDPDGILNPNVLLPPSTDPHPGPDEGPR